MHITSDFPDAKFAFAKNRCCTSYWRCQRSRHQRPSFLLGTFLILTSCSGRKRRPNSFALKISRCRWVLSDCQIGPSMQRSLVLATVQGSGSRWCRTGVCQLTSIHCTAKENESLLAGVTRRSWEGGHNIWFFDGRDPKAPLHCCILMILGVLMCWLQIHCLSIGTVTSIGQALFAFVQELRATAEAILFAGPAAHSDVDGSMLLEERDAAESPKQRFV